MPFLSRPASVPFPRGGLSAMSREQASNDLVRRGKVLRMLQPAWHDRWRSRTRLRCTSVPRSSVRARHGAGYSRETAFQRRRTYDHQTMPANVDQSGSASAREWIGQLPPVVAPQAAALTRLLEAVEADPRLRALALAGSVARGEADEHSDLDTCVWIRDDDFDATIADLPSLARAVGGPLDILFERPGSPFLFVQYVDGVQLELLAKRASDTKRRPQGEVVLLDRDGLLQHAEEPEAPCDVELWSGWAWMALFDLDKYLRRGSLWEALIKLEKARTLLLRHHAAETGIPDPQFGVTSILDFDGSLPEGLDETVAGLDATDLRRAGYACAELLVAYDPRPFGDFVLSRLATSRQ